MNELVEQGLKISEISLIKHNDIRNMHLDHWGLHLNMHGSSLLTGNFIDFLKVVRLGHVGFSHISQTGRLPFPRMCFATLIHNLQAPLFRTTIAFFEWSHH